MAASILKTVRVFFGMNLAEKNEWVPLPQEDKDQIIQGLTDRTLTY